MMLSTFLASTVQSPLAQAPEPTGTQKFFEWYFYGIGGIGGWLIFLLLGLIATIWLLYDSQKRHIPAIGWRMGVILLTLLLVPTMLYRFTVTAVHYRLWRLLQVWINEPDCELAITQQTSGLTFTTCEELMASLPPMTPYAEYVFYLGLMGGVLAPILAIGYYVTFQGMVGCIRGHEPYEAVLGRCPVCAAEEARARQPQQIPVTAGVVHQERRRIEPLGQPVAPPKPTVSYAWLVDLSNNRRYDLCQGSTRIGRNPECDVYLTDPSVSRLHAFIRETKGHFTLADGESRTGTLLNDKRIRTPQVMQNGDRITVGDTVLQFVTARS